MPLDLQTQLQLLQMQVDLIQREINLLREQVAQSQPPSNPPRTFASLRGIWADVVIIDDDIRASRLELPKDL